MNKHFSHLLVKNSANQNLANKQLEKCKKKSEPKMVDWKCLNIYQLSNKKYITKQLCEIQELLMIGIFWNKIIPFRENCMH